MSIVGKWVAHYDWGNTGNYGTTVMNFNSDGTFTNDQGSNGNWNLLDGNLVFIFPNGVTYSGNVCGGAMIGTMNSLGSWYNLRDTNSVVLSASDLELKASGEKI